MTQMGNDALRECPFCGCQPIPENKNFRFEHDIDCIFTKGHYLIPDEFKAWNTRNAPPALVPLNKNSHRLMMINFIGDYMSKFAARTGSKLKFRDDMSDVVAEHNERICAKFGRPKLPTLDEIRDVCRNEYKDDLELAKNILSLLEKENKHE